MRLSKHETVHLELVDADSAEVFAQTRTPVEQLLLEASLDTAGEALRDKTQRAFLTN